MAQKKTVRRLPRVIKGKRATFHQSTGVDELFAMVAALTAELSVVCERQRSLEAVLVKGRKIQATSIEAYRISKSELLERAAAREGLIERVFQVLETNE